MIADGFTITAIAAGTGDEAAVAATANMRLMGYSVKETAAAVATLVLHHGTSASGTATAFVNLAAAGSTTEWFGPQGIPMPSGVWIERLTGTTAVTVYTKVAS